VVLIAGHTEAPLPDGVEIVQVCTAKEMLDAVLRYADWLEVFVGAAAVADFTPKASRSPPSCVGRRRSGSFWS
jgi:phosphopantothenoylcysteine decarboxylase/phosphopantothenate--cysteine ligase